MVAILAQVLFSFSPTLLTLCAYVSRLSGLRILVVGEGVPHP